MNIDQRLEALTQTVELVAGMQKENEQRIAELTHAVKIHEQERVRVYRAMRAALDVWFNENGSEESNS